MTDAVEVTLYLRKSTVDEGRSVARQRATLTESAAGEGLAVGKVFCDPDFSASRFAKRARPDYAALLAHIEAGECGVVGLFEASRGSRTLTEWSRFLDLCAGRKVRIWIHDDRIYRPWRTNDWDTLARLGVASATESNQKSDRITDGKRAAAREGRPPGRIPYGFTRTYEAVPGGKRKRVTQIPDPVESAVVVELVRRVAQRDAMQEIARDFERRGITTRSGGRWLPTVIRQTVLNPAYAGQRVHQGEVIGTATWAPVVDVEQWQLAVAVLNQPDRRMIPRGTGLSHWLTGAARCGSCNKDVLRSGNRAGGRGRVYRCKRCHASVSALGLEQAVEYTILGRFAQPYALSAFPVETNNDELHIAEQKVVDLKARLDAHYAEAARGRLSASGLSAVEALLLPDITAAAEKAEGLRLPSALAKYKGVDVVKEWPGWPPSKRRDLVVAVADLVVAPATRRGPKFDTRRLGGSRWFGDDRTWAELWAGIDIAAESGSI